MFDDDHAWKISCWALLHDDIPIAHRFHGYSCAGEDIEAFMVRIGEIEILLIPEMISKSLFRIQGPSPITYLDVA